MKEIKYQQKYVRELVDMTIDLLYRKGGWYMCFTPLPRADGKGGIMILREGYPMAISLLSGNSYLTGWVKKIALPS